MNCYVHPDCEAVETCVSCRRAICAQCRAEIAGHSLCPTCLQAAQARIGTEVAPPPADVPFATMASPTAPSADAPFATIAPPTFPHSQSPYPPTRTPTASPSLAQEAPGVGIRILRGLLWGGLYGQWWTLWTALSMLLWGGLRGEGASPLVIAVVLMIYAMIYGFAGVVTGAIVAFTNGTRATGTIVGVVMGLCLCGLEALLLQNGSALFNVVFFFFTGRFVGSGLAGRVWGLGPGDN